MKIMVIGGGGREHAIIQKLKENPAVQEIFALPGNGGIAADATCVPIGAKDLDAQVRFAREQQIDFAVVAPDDPLVLGAVDALEEAGIPCFGPRKNAAILEGHFHFDGAGFVLQINLLEDISRLVIGSDNGFHHFFLANGIGLSLIHI